MKIKQYILYIVIHHDLQYKKSSVGYLPLDIILRHKDSKLFKAMFGKTWVDLEHHEYGGLSGIYYDKSLAQEHVRLEKEFRKYCKQHYEILTIKPPI
jgi:hypothetical protein